MTLCRPAAALLALGLVWTALPGDCQSNAGSQPVVRGPAISQGSRGNPTTVQPGQDPFASLVAGAASFDMDSPVEATAVFDPPTVALGERVIYRITVSALDESFKIPDSLPVPPGLELIPGGRGQIYQPTGNAKVRPQTTIVFRAKAGTNGVFTMPSFDALAYGKALKIPEAKLTVVASGEAAGQGAPRLFLRLPADDVYVGQMLRIPLVLPMPADGTVHGLSQPSISGEFIFSDQGVSGARQENVRMEGRNFVAFVQEVTITPLREGPHELIGQAYSFTTRPIPGQSNAAQTVTEFIDSDPVVLSVKPLPTEGRLPGFTGAVGSLQVDAPRLSTNDVRAGEPLTITITIRGDANVGRLTPPPPPAVRDWQAFPPIGESINPLLVQLRGYANFSYTLIPMSDKVAATPAIPFSFFNPSQKKYVNLTVPPMAVKVRPAPGGVVPPAQPTAPSIPFSEGDDASVRERDLVMTGLAESPGRTVTKLAPLQSRGWFLALQLVPAIGLVFLWMQYRRNEHLARHPEVLLKRRARREMRRQLRLARQAAGSRNAAGFVSGATNALREACAPHAAANPEALVCADILQELPGTDQEGPAGETVRQLFAAADALRFGGTSRDNAELLALEPELERVAEHLKARL